MPNNPQWSAPFNFRGLIFRASAVGAGVQVYDPRDRRWYDTAALYRRTLEADYADVPDIQRWRNRMPLGALYFERPDLIFDPLGIIEGIERDVARLKELRQNPIYQRIARHKREREVILETVHTLHPQAYQDRFAHIHPLAVKLDAMEADIMLNKRERRIIEATLAEDV